MTVNFKVGDIVLITHIDYPNNTYDIFKGNVGRITTVLQQNAYKSFAKNYPYMLKLISGNKIGEDGLNFEEIGWNDSEITLVKNINWKNLLKGDKN